MMMIYHRGVPPRRRGHDYEEEDYGGRRVGRASSYHYDDDYDDYEYDRRSTRHQSAGSRRRGDNRFEQPDAEREAGRRRDGRYHKKESPPIAPGPSSPKKHMSTLRDMMISEDPRERQEKNQKGTDIPGRIAKANRREEAQEGKRRAQGELS